MDELEFQTRLMQICRAYDAIYESAPDKYTGEDVYNYYRAKVGQAPIRF